MSYCRKEGKDTIIFATKENHEEPSTVKLPPIEKPPGLILPDGNINWNCPCLGGMATGPCGIEFREAFTCFHYSKADPKGSDCLDPFRTMTQCMQNYPALYDSKDDESMYPEDDDEFEPIEPKESATNKVESASSSQSTSSKK
ncbi:mitochondrial intermembrane space import and assembly protein 40 [Planococcus citri]|uniref:mitochondrial intermembrane space import and assembly protein 40 n=1 Tax=Planococcus citri TaxID=170843 RepID=UPI0031F72D7C